MNMFISRFPFALISLLCATGFSVSRADDYSWNATGNGNWGSNTNWRVNGVQPVSVPGAGDNIVGFNDAGTGALQMNGSRSINNLVFDNTARDLDIINASSNSDVSLIVGGTLSVNTTRTLIFRGDTGVNQRLFSLNIANLNLAAGVVRFGSAANTSIQAFSSTGSALISGGTASFVLANSGTAFFNSLTVNGGLLNVVGLTSGSGGLSAATLSGAGGVIQAQGSSGTALGHLIVGSSGTSTYGGTIANGGSGNILDFTKVGAGLQILTGANTFTGTTTISAGTLQLGAGGASGSLAGSILNNSRLAFDRSDVAVHSNAISGSGTVAQIGTGATVLTGNNTYTGLTTVSSGTLQVGNGGSLGSVTGDISIENGAALVVARTGVFSYGGTISGANGTITKQNSGSWILTAANTFSGVTEVAPGTANNNITLAHTNALQNSTVNVRVANGLRFSNVSDTYTIGTLQGSGEVALNDTDGDAITLRVGNNNTNLSSSHTGTLSGLGTLEKVGVGAQRLTGNNTYSGGTVISEGSLLVNNTAGSGLGVGAVEVKNNATLGGLGYIALGSSNSITVEAGGRIAAGTTGIGVLTFDFGGTTGGLQALDNSAFVFDLGSSNDSDLVRLFHYTAGDFTLGDTVHLGFSNAQVGEYTLFSFYSDAGSTLYAGTFDISNFEVSGLSDYTYSLNYADGFVSLSVVPEPATVQILLLSAGVMVFLFRRRRSLS